TALRFEKAIHQALLLAQRRRHGQEIGRLVHDHQVVVAEQHLVAATRALPGARLVAALRIELDREALAREKPPGVTGSPPDVQRTAPASMRPRAWAWVNPALSCRKAWRVRPASAGPVSR